MTVLNVRSPQCRLVTIWQLLTHLLCGRMAHVESDSDATMQRNDLGMQPACTYFRMSAVVRLLSQESHPLVSGAATLRGNLGEYQAHSAVTKHTDVGLGCNQRMVA